jgi:release factor glutamine methyltransferase
LNEFVTIAEALRTASAALEPVSDSPRLDAELLLARAIDVPRSYLIAHPEDTLDSASSDRFHAAVAKRGSGMPIAYITGEKEFWSMTLMVSPATLVPRPDTEVLVEQALGYIPRRAAYRVLDLGTGSGAIALAIARERPLCDVVATDISADAVAIARENARQLDLANVSFLTGDWIEPVRDQRFDVVVSNPPYVRADDPALEALAHEPCGALVSGDDGLDDIRRIAADALAIIGPGGCLLIEHGADQGRDVAAILEDAGWHEVRVIRDLGGRDRVCFARAPGN